MKYPRQAEPLLGRSVVGINPAKGLTTMQQSSIASQGRSAEFLAQAQKSALEMASQLGTLAFNYAMELNKTWFELTQNHLKQYASFPHRLAHCRTPEEVFSAQADLIGRATNEYKERLSAHASMIEKATQGYKEGVDQLANFGQRVAREAERAVQQAQELAQDSTRKAVRSAEEVQQGLKSRARGGSKSERPDSEKEDQAQRAH
jgi:hypothetical protein